MGFLGEQPRQPEPKSCCIARWQRCCATEQCPRSEPWRVISHADFSAASKIPKRHPQLCNSRGSERKPLTISADADLAYASRQLGDSDAQPFAPPRSRRSRSTGRADEQTDIVVLISAWQPAAQPCGIAPPLHPRQPRERSTLRRRQQSRCSALHLPSSAASLPTRPGGRSVQ